MKLLFVRTRMVGTATPSCAYNIYIPIEEHPCGNGMTYRIWRDGRYYLPFSDIYVTSEHMGLPVGYERYDKYKELKKASEALEDRLLQEQFPEFREFSADKRKTHALWIGGIDLSSKEFTIEIEIPQLATA